MLLATMRSAMTSHGSFQNRPRVGLAAQFLVASALVGACSSSGPSSDVQTETSGSGGSFGGGTRHVLAGRTPQPR